MSVSARPPPTYPRAQVGSTAAWLQIHAYPHLCLCGRGLCQKDYLCKQWPVPWPIPMYVPLHSLFCRGGGLYQQEHLYEFCDRHGLIVWQRSWPPATPTP